MKVTVYKERKTKALSELLGEYEEECLNAVRLIEGLKIPSLTEDQSEDILGELSASITHLKVHSEELEKLIEEEL